MKNSYIFSFAVKAKAVEFYNCCKRIKGMMIVDTLGPCDFEVIFKKGTKAITILNLAAVWGATVIA